MSKVVDVSGGGEGWKNWQIALAVGIPAAVAGIYFYKRYSSKRGVVAKGQEGKQPKSQKSSEEKIDKKAQAFKKQGNDYFRAHDYENAIECYTKAIESSSGVTNDDLSTFHQNRAASYEHLKNYAQVINDCTRALELNPKYVKALNRRAKAFKETGFLTEALEDVTAACILENFTNQANIMLADSVVKELSQQRAVDKIKNILPCTPSPIHVWNVISSFSHDPVFKPKSVYNQNNIDDLENNKNEPSPYQKALKEFYEDNFKNILTLCAEEINSTDSHYKLESYSMRGTFYFLRGEHDKALTDFQTILDNEGACEKFKVNSLIKIGKLKMHKNQTQEALDAFDQAVAIDPSNSDIYMHRGQLHLIMDNLETAIADFDKSISLTNNLPVPHIHKCYTEVRKLLAEGNPEAAEKVAETFKDILERFPSNADGYAFYGQALLDLQQFERADECFKKAIELEPNNPSSYVHRGILKLTWQEDLEEAITLMRKALQIDSRSCFALQALGTLELQRGQSQVAMELLKKAVECSTSEAEMTHLFSILVAAEVQHKVALKFGVPLPPLV